MSSIWSEKYRPKRIDDVILPAKIKNMFKNFASKGQFPNLLLSGDSGVGKTTLAKALCNELGWAFLVINASSMQMEELRTTVSQFVTTRSLDNPNNMKVVILDEADHLNNHLQPSLRNFMEEHSGVCRFVLTCNYPNKILKPLRSRCTEISFSWTPEERKDLFVQFAKSCIAILTKEGIAHNPKVIGEIVKTYFPDNRKVLNELQRYANINGTIDEGLLSSTISDFKPFYAAMKRRNFPEIRKFIEENKELGDNIFTVLFDEGLEHIEKSSTPEFILIVANYAYKHYFVTDPAINFSAMAVELMTKVQWK